MLDMNSSNIETKYYSIIPFHIFNIHLWKFRFCIILDKASYGSTKKFVELTVLGLKINAIHY